MRNIPRDGSVWFGAKAVVRNFPPASLDSEAMGLNIPSVSAVLFVAEAAAV